MRPGFHSQKKEIHLIPKGEWRWVVIFAAVVMLITSLPYIYAYTQQESNVYTGFLLGVDDGNSYIAKMARGSSGDWLFTTPYTAYPQKVSLIYIPYLILGKLAAPPALHEQLVVLFHIYRFVAGMCAIIASYFFITIFISTTSTRRLALILLTLGGGLGWVIILTGQTNWLGSPPLEFFSPEAFGFLEIYGLPT